MGSWKKPSRKHAGKRPLESWPEEALPGSLQREGIYFPANSPTPTEGETIQKEEVLSGWENPAPGTFREIIYQKAGGKPPSLRIAQIFLLVFIILALLPFVKGILLEVLCRFWGFLLTFGVSLSALSIVKDRRNFQDGKNFSQKAAALQWFGVPVII